MEGPDIPTVEFTPVPRDDRSRPGRRRTITGELYLDRFLEHREASQFLDEVMRVGSGEGVKTIVRALLHYRDTVARPLQESQTKARPSRGGSPARSSKAKPVAPGQLSLT